nr:phosphatidylinositol-specific phospholipase C1-like protein [uncultured Neokomagataea sp.]
MKYRLAFLSVIGSLVTQSAFAAGIPQDVRLNQIQVVGTHNSYRTDISPATLQWLTKFSPQAAEALDYKHTTLDRQLDSGVRQLEIDIYADSKGGQYSHPRGADWERKSGITPDAPSGSTALMQGRDFKVMHIVDIDQRSNCEPFAKCLQIIRDWSAAHPRHLPVFIDIETKQDIPLKSDKLQFTVPERFTTATYDRLDQEIVQVIGRKNLILPDDVRGNAPSLNEAIRTKGWPSVESERGKIMFVLDRPQDTERYVANHPGLRGRVLFTNGRPGEPDAAYTEVNEGFAGQKGATFDNAEAAHKTPDLVKQGYLVRTRADANTVEARTNDVTRRDVSFASGAQIISTDYPALEPAPWHGYTVEFPDHAVARCNPVNAPTDCNNADFIHEK